MTNEFKGGNERIGVSLDEYYLKLALKLRHHFELKEGTKFSLSAVIRLSLIALAENEKISI